MLVAVKPGYVIEVLTQVAEGLKPGALVISVAAGITTAAMQAAVADNVAVVRAMPKHPRNRRFVRLPASLRGRGCRQSS